ncbi:hypothetical protein WICMUC_003789 [Wickerhamomyces mucosus]|uniref:Vacuolar protein sorting-associated protein 8 central domain-containing protein n=1 Tax=Wickerhamomyces mucosus TaxID=1378264 RepID=A0A9P8PKZ2_9ASCO|nr:hypothetical protein WICMUC_003789 [Wickerhamomyces mucosus]
MPVDIFATMESAKIDNSISGIQGTNLLDKNSAIYQTYTKNNLNETQSKFEGFESPNISYNSSMNSSNTRSRRFDERVRSRISGLLEPRSSPNRTEVDTRAQPSDNPGSPHISSIKWADLYKLNTFLHKNESKALYGEATCIAASEILAIGTSKGYILVFDYRQTLLHVLGGNTIQLECGSAICLNISLDSTHIAAGFIHGDVFVWAIKNDSKPLIHIPPQRIPQETSDGHIEGSSITSICFVGKKNSVLLSGDVHGMVFYHQINKRLLGVTSSTTRVLGHHLSNAQSKSTTILACSSLPLGAYTSSTEAKGLVAVMNQNALVIISTTNSIRTQFKTGRPQNIDLSYGNSGCLAWFPSYILSDGRKLPPKLAYSFNNIMTIIELTTGYDDSILFRSKKRYVCDELIIGLQWINHSLIALITHTQNFLLINEISMKASNKIDLLSKHLFTSDVYSRLASHQSFRTNYNSTFKIFKGKIFFVGRYEILIGSLPSWIDVLLDAIRSNNHSGAIELARSFYSGQDLDLEILGLPCSATERHNIVLGYLIDMVKVSSARVLNEEYDDRSIKEFIFSSIKALSFVNADLSILEDFYESIKSRSLESLFFESLETFIFNGSVQKLTPVILKDMVSYYIIAGKSEQLEQYICLLDIKSLDIDFTLALLKSNGLIDSYIYIWNSLLKDYISPLLELIHDIRIQNEQTSAEDNERIYSYLAYVLTGRQYPTENQIADLEATDAKLSIYYLLFNGTYVDGDSYGTTAEYLSFPYLTLLIKTDSKAFLSALNESFEDSLLNDDEIIHKNQKLKVNRQFVLEILIEVFSNKKEIQDSDRLNLSIFIARNYPKFQQFIRLPETILDETVTYLCSYNSRPLSHLSPEIKEDSELSLQSLLSVYQPSNKSKFIDFFQKAGFHEILINVYLNDKKFSKVLQVWLQLDETKSIDTTQGVLEKCLKSTEANKTERKKIVEVIEENFPIVIEVDTFKVVQLFNKYIPLIHKRALNLKDSQLKYLYLLSLSQLEKTGEYKMNVLERTELVKGMSIYDKDILKLYSISLKPTDFDLSSCIIHLKNNRCIDTLLYFLNSSGEYQQSLDEIVDYMTDLIDQLSILDPTKSVKIFDKIEIQLWKYLKAAIEISNMELTQSKTIHKTNDLSKDEKMWVQLINFIVSQLKKYDVDSTPARAVDIIKRLLQDLFSTLINTRSKASGLNRLQDIQHTQSSFLKIFTGFINSSSVNVTVLGDIRSVTREIYLAFTYEKHILNITSNLINEIVYQNIQESFNENKTGWSVKSFECSACGKVIWGRGIDSDAYIAWAFKPHDNFKYTERTFDLVSFDCSHSYHITCLENLGVSKDSYSCIICDTNY